MRNLTRVFPIVDRACAYFAKGLQVELESLSVTEMLRSTLIVFAALALLVSAESVDDQFAEWLESPPAEAVQAAADVRSRAKKLASTI